jgi:hypothetical protein
MSSSQSQIWHKVGRLTLESTPGAGYRSCRAELRVSVGASIVGAVDVPREADHGACALPG